MGVLNEAAIERAIKAQTDVLREVLAELTALREASGAPAPATTESRGAFGRRG